MADTFDAGKFGAIVALPFAVANAVTNQTATDLAALMEGGSNTLLVMPAAGSVIGISVKSSADVTAGSATFRAHKASTEFADSGYPAPVLNTTYSNATYATIRPGAMTFSAGDRVGISYASATDMAPTNTNDFAAVLFVQLNAV